MKRNDLEAWIEVIREWLTRKVLINDFKRLIAGHLLVVYSRGLRNGFPNLFSCDILETFGAVEPRD